MCDKSKLLKQRTGKKIKQIAFELGYSPNMLYMILNGKATPSWELARSLARLIGEEPTFFLPE